MNTNIKNLLRLIFWTFFLASAGAMIKGGDPVNGIICGGTIGFIIGMCSIKGSKSK